MQENGSVDQFLDNPSAYFGHSLTRMMKLSGPELEQLQLASLQRRFAQFRGSLPMFDKLADSQGISAIAGIEDVLPLLFGHEIYKSYPASLLDKHQFKQLTAWLNKLTTVDLSQVDVSACRTIDDWLITLGRETPLSIVHTSGTSGSMSFLPWSKSEWRRCMEQFTVLSFQRFGHQEPAPEFPLNIECIYPFLSYRWPIAYGAQRCRRRCHRRHRSAVPCCLSGATECRLVVACHPAPRGRRDRAIGATRYRP